MRLRRDEQHLPAPHRGRRDGVFIALGLLAGLLVAVFGGDVLARVRGDHPAGPADSSVTRDIRQDVDPVVTVAKDDEGVAPSPAASPGEAVERFLAAEVEGDHARSLALLTQAGRVEYRSAAAWRAAHANIFPVRSYEMGTVDERAADAEVLTRIRYRSTLDEVIGLVPARAQAAWRVLRESGGWLVDFDATEVTPILPDDTGASASVRRWVAARQRCEPAEEYSAGLVGRATLADRLCGTDGPPSLGPVGRLDPSDGAPFVSAFGAPAATWARTVDVRSPVALTVVLAPVEDRWLVVGVLAGR